MTHVVWILQAVAEQTYESKATWQAWLSQYRAQLRAESRPEAERVSEMNAANPCYVPRNHLLQICIDAAQKGDYSEVMATPLLHCSDSQYCRQIQPFTSML